MVNRLIDLLPSLQLLEAAPLSDVSAIVLEHARHHVDERGKARSDLVLGQAEPYMQDRTVSEPPDSIRRRASRVVSEAVSWLVAEGLMCPFESPGVSGPTMLMVTRLGRSIQNKNDFSSYMKAALIPRALLRDDLATIVYPLFLAGHYDEAVLAAFVHVEVEVRRAAGYGNESYGKTMMRKAFKSVEAGQAEMPGPLTDVKAEKSEQDGLSHLFAGAIAFYKNPPSHRELDIDDARVAASRILVANELLMVLAARPRP